MKLPVIKTIQKTCTPEQIETALAVLENISEAPSLKEPEIDVIGVALMELISAQMQ